MQWLPTYLSKNLSANEKSISLTALPYIVNSLVGIGKRHYYYFNDYCYYCINDRSSPSAD